MTWLIDFRGRKQVFWSGIGWENAPTTEQPRGGSCLLRLTPLILLTIGLFITGSVLLNIGIRELTSLALQAGNVPLAESILANALKIKPNSAQVYDALGFVQSQQGKNAEADGIIPTKPSIWIQPMPVPTAIWE